MKKWMYRILVIVGLMLTNMVTVVGQNLLNNVLGATSTTTATVAYSVRQMSTSYTGPLMRIRNSTSGNLYDVWPDASGQFSTTSLISAANPGTTPGTKGASALSTITSTTTFTVAIWYDQSGNARNLTQSTTSRYPTIINAGTINTKNGKVAINYDATDDGLLYTGSDYFTANPISVNIVAGSNSANAYLRRAVQGATNMTNNWLIGPYLNQHSWFAGDWNHQISTAWSTTALEAFTVIQPTSNANTSWRNGVSQTSGNNKGLPGRIQTGASVVDEPLDGVLSEVIAFASDLSIKDRQSIESSQGTYFGITVPAASAPTSIAGTTTICNGSSTTLTSTGGNYGFNVEDIWYRGGYGGDAYDNGWDVTTAISSSSGDSRINNNTNGILNVTSTGTDPYFYMPSLGSFNPSTYKYVNVRYRVTAGTGGNMQVFFLNTTYTSANGSATVNSPTLNSDGNWHTVSIDMSTSAAWTTGGNITGWRFDWSNNTGVTMDIDFIQLGTGVILEGTTSLTVSPTTNTTYYLNRKGPSVNTSSISQLVTVRSAFTTGAILTTGQTICSGGTPTVIGSSIASSGGDGTITYSWRSSADSYASAISGATSATYTPPAGLTSTTSYQRYARDFTCNTTPTVSTGTWTVTVNAIPAPTFTAQPGARASVSTDVTYTTEASQTNYSWTVPGTLNTDYSITSGGVGTTSNTVTLKWLTAGSKTVTINYTNSNSCTAASATSSTATTVIALNNVGLSTTAVASAYSLRKLSSNYTGPLVRILIGSNFYDVYPDATSGAFATTSLISAAQSTYNAAVASAGASALSSIVTAGTTNATVSIWYDQSGNGINVLQATTAKQPNIITSGTINTYSGKPTMYFNASNTGGVYFQSATSYQSLNNTPYTLSAVCQTPSGGAASHNTAIGTGNTGAQNRSLNFGYNSTTGNVLKIGQGSNTSSFAQIPQNNKLSLLTGIRNNTGGASAFLNGNASGSSQMSGAGTSPTYATQYLATNSTTDYLNIGAGYTPGAYDWIGSISEVILFPSDLSASRATLESNQSAYYDVPLISSHPSTSTQSLCVNAAATAITVTASATSSLSYQWYSNTTNSNITGGVSLGSTSGAQTSSYTPSTAAAGTLYYYCIVTNATSGAYTISNVSGAITVNALPTPTFTAQPGATVCASTDVTYTTEAGQSNYIWTVPGTLSTDYTITSGGVGTSSNTVTLKWLTTGSKTVTINYTNANSCTAASATSSTATTVSALPTPTFTAQPGATACVSTDVTYTTQSGQSNYVWTVPGTLSTDYTITSGGIGTTSNTVTLKWLTAGSKTVTINYTNANSCAAASATSSTATTVSAPSVAGTISGGDVSVVSGSNSTTLTLSGYTGTIQWQSSTTSSSSGFSNIGSATSATYTATNLSAATYYQAVVTNGVCTSATASSVTITILTVPSISYGVSGTQTYVTNSAISQLTVTNTGGTVSGVYKQVSVIAGSGSASFNDGTGTSATFNALTHIAINSSGDLFVADANNNRIRKITAAGVVTTFAGSGVASSTDGQGTAATFNNPQGIAINAQGDIFVADTYGSKIRKITASGAVSTFAGTGSIGSSDNATGTSATFGYPSGLCFDASGNLFVADPYSQKIRKITPAGAVSTYGSSQYYIGIRGMAFDNAGNLYVSSNGNGERLIYKITPSETVSVFVGSTFGDVDGNGTSVKTGAVGSMQFGNDNYIYFTDVDKNKIKRMSLSADVTTVVGGTILDGNGSSTALSTPYGFVFDGLGNAYTSEYSGNTIKKISFLGYTISPSLPSGLSFSSSNGTISGTPTTTTAATTYTITATNAAGSSSTTVSLATGPTNTITLSSAAGTNAQTVCANTAITNISYNTTSATGATFSGLPTGVSGTWLANVVTISGTPTVAGSYSYTVTLTGGIGTVTATGTITVSETPVIASQSTTTQTVCQNATAASFSVTATGSGTITYQWYSNTSASTTSATNLGSANGAQTATYTPQTTATGTKYYYCIVTMGSCTATSAFSGAVVVTPLSVAGSISGAGGTCYGTAKTLTLSGNTGTIQWQVSTTSSSSGFSDISGATASTYVVSTSTAVGTYYYQAVVTNGVCSAATTSSVTVNVNALPVIASQSTATQTVCQNATASAFSVSATGTGLTYQWYSNASNNNTSGTTLGTATGAQTATYTPLTTAAGTLYYYCVATNSNGCTATSAVSGAVVVNAVPVVAGVAQAGGFGNGLNLDGGNDHVSVATVSGLNFNVTNEITVEAWVKVIKDGCDFWLTMGSGFNYRFGTCDNIPYWDMGQHSDKTATNVTLTDNTWYHMAFSASMVGSTIKTNVYIDGTLRYTQDEGISTLPASTLIRLGAGEYSIYHNFKGTMDEVRIWNVARTQAQIQASMSTELAGTETGLVAYYNFNNGTAGGTNTGLTTLTDRTSNANNGTLTNFALTGSTSNWVDGVTLSGASTLGAVCVNSTIQLSNTTTGGTWSTSDATIATVDNTGLVTGIAAGSATISYTVTNASNCSTTATSSVTVNALPVITSQSTAAQRVIQNGTASAFSVTATGTGLTYQWYSNTTASNTGGTSIGSATSSTYTPPTTTVGTTYYYCIVTTTSGCTATSAVSGAVIIEQMYITSTGIIGTVCYSSTAQTSSLVYTATANNPNSYSIDWNAAANTAGLADQTSTAYTFASGSGTIPDIAISAGATAGTYSGTLTIRNANNITATVAVTITINPLPTITTSGTATAKCFSTSAQTTSLVYSATTQSPISYSIDWNAAANTAGLADQTSTSYTFVAGGGTLSSIAIPANIAGGTYTGTMTFTNANGCANTQAISYTSYALPIAGIRNNTSTTVLTSTVTSISLTATGGSTYSWSDGSTVVSTTAAYRVTAPGTYTVTVTNTNGCSSTASITITQTSTPPVTSITNNTGTTELNCTTTSISLTATGGGTYSWSNGTSVVATSAGLSVTTPGTYTVTVTNGGTTTSSITITQNVVTSGTAVLTGSATITSGKSANLQATISIGNAPYTVIISDGSTQYTTYSYYSGPNIVVTPSATSTYTLVSVTGANGCAVTSLSGSATVTINSGGTSKVWTGAAGDDLWSTAGNWSPAGTPASNDFLTISSGTPQLDVYFTVTGSLTVNGTGTLTVNAGKSIDIGAEGVVDFGKRDITFKSSATGTAQLGKIEGTLSNADSVIVERYFPAGRRAYRFISASVTTPSSIRYNWMENATPVYTYTTIYTTLSAYNPKLAYGTHITGTGGNTNGFDRTALNTSTLYTLNTTTQAWVGVGSTAGTLAAGDAYRILIRGDRAINLNNNNTYANATTIRTKGAPKVGMHTVSSSLSTIADGWSLVGNPYQSLVDLRAVSTTNLTPYYSVWDPQRGTRGAYVSYHLGTGIKSNIASDVNELVQPGQAFFVQTMNAGAATLTFDESNKAPLGTQTNVFRAIANYPVLNVALNYTDSLANGAPEMDAFAVVFDNSFSNSVDKEDAPKNYNQDDNMGITRDDKLLAMELRDMYNATTVIPMNMVNYVRTDYTMRINWSNPVDAGYEAYLKDNYTGAMQTISFGGNTDYVFTVNSSIAASKATDRFSILFIATATLPVSGLVLNGAAEGKQVKLQFDALNEREMLGYTIQRSADGVSFEQIGEQAAVNGNVASRSYAFIDNKPVTGNNYYRIKGTSVNGQVQYSNIKLIKLGNSMPTVLVTPNPANNDKLQLKVAQLLKGSYTLTVTDALGRVFCQKELVYDGVSGVMELKFPSVAKSGSYYVQVNGESGSFTEAFIIR